MTSSTPRKINTTNNHQQQHHHHRPRQQQQQQQQYQAAKDEPHHSSIESAIILSDKSSNLTNFSIEAIIGQSSCLSAIKKEPNTEDASIPIKPTIGSSPMSLVDLPPLTIPDEKSRPPSSAESSSSSRGTATGDTAAATGGRGASRKVRPKNFFCPACNLAFANNGQLRNHARIHTGERPFKCQFDGCNKTFTRNEELTRHNLIHSGFRPHACNTCDKRFGRKDHLNKHLKTHENKRFRQLRKRTFLPTCLRNQTMIRPNHGLSNEQQYALTQNSMIPRHIDHSVQTGGPQVKQVRDAQFRIDPKFIHPAPPPPPIPTNFVDVITPTIYDLPRLPSLVPTTTSETTVISSTSDSIIQQAAYFGAHMAALGHEQPLSPSIQQLAEQWNRWNSLMGLYYQSAGQYSQAPHF